MNSDTSNSLAPGTASWQPRVPRSVPHSRLVVGLLALLLLARQPADFLHPQFNAEEGAVFFQEAYNNGFLSSLSTPESGYYHLALRLTAGLALLVPLTLAPLVFKVVALAIQMLPVAYLLADGVAGYVVTPLFRILVATVYLFGPNTDEIYLNVNNSQWHLTLTASLILLSGPRTGKVRRALDALVLIVFAGSGPFSLVCAPLALWAWRKRTRDGRDHAARVAPLIVVAGAFIQGAYLFSGSRAIGGAAGYGIPTFADFMRIIALQGVSNSLLGKNFTVRYGDTFPFEAILVAGALIPVLAFVAIRLRNAALMVLLTLAGTSVAVAFVFPLNDPRLLQNPNFGPRYFFFTMLFVLATLIAMVERGRWWLWSAIPGLAIVLMFGIRGDFLISAVPNTHWPDQITAFRTLSPGEEFFIPVYPQPSEWGLTLRQKHPPNARDVFARYPSSSGHLIAAIEKIGTTLPQDSRSPDQKVFFMGYAVDATSMKPAGGAFLQIDGRVFPVVTGIDSLSAAEIAREPTLGQAGFARFVPRTEVGTGTHTVRVLALNHDSSAFLRFGPSTTFILR